MNNLNGGTIDGLRPGDVHGDARPAGMHEARLVEIEETLDGCGFRCDNGQTLTAPSVKLKPSDVRALIAEVRRLSAYAEMERAIVNQVVEQFKARTA